MFGILGPRIDETNNLLCNQWYHRECIEMHDKNNIPDDIDKSIWFGNKCMHKLWYDSLNDNLKKIVEIKIQYLRNKIDQSYYLSIVRPLEKIEKNNNNKKNDKNN